MKYLKTKNISKFSIKDNTYIQNTYGRITIDSNNSIRLPKGTGDENHLPGTPENQRPNTATISNLTGAIRYNTTTSSIEAYIGFPGNESWEIVKAPSSAAISRSNGLGPGDAVERFFGPLNPSFTRTFIASGDNIIVLVENVWQIWITNFNIVENPAGTPEAAFYAGASTYPEGYYLEFSDPVPLGKFVTVYYGFSN
jgi:hypothetical protein